MLRTAVTILRRMGIDVSRYNTRKRLAREPEFAIRALLAGQDVRTVLDVGANLGQSAQSFLEMFPDATVHSFEPVPDTCEALRNRLAGHPRFRAWQLAVSDSEGPREICINADHTTSSLLETGDAFKLEHLRDKHQTVRRATIDCTTLDSFCEEKGLESVDLLKLDIQGAELSALRGGVRMLTRQRIAVVRSEVQFAPLYEGACRFEEVVGLMRDHGYRIYGLYELQHFPDEGLLWGDAVFVLPELLRRSNRPAS